MTRIEVIRPFVERTIAEYLGIDDDALEVLDDGTIPIGAGTAVVNVRLVEGHAGRPLLSVFSPLLHDVERTSELLEKLNEVNSSLWFTRVFWADRRVILAMELLAEDLDRDQVEHAVSLVSFASDHWDGELREAFGGEVENPKGEAPPPPVPAAPPEPRPQRTGRKSKTGPLPATSSTPPAGRCPVGAWVPGSLGFVAGAALLAPSSVVLFRGVQGFARGVEVTG